MTDSHFGIRDGARIALGLALAASLVVPGFAQQADTPAPSTSRPIDFRLPPAENDGRTPGVQGPANNGIAPVGPGETRPTPTPAPTPPAPPRPAPTQPAARPTTQPATPPNAATDAAPARRAPATETRSPAPDVVDAAPAPTDAADPAPGFAPNITEPAEEAQPAAAPIDDTAPEPAPATGDGNTPVWAWLLALLAAGAAGFWYWRRRPALAGDAPVERSAVPAEPRPAVPPASRATQAPKPAPAPPVPAGGDAAQRAPSPLVTRPAPERRAVVGLALEVTAIRVTPDHIAVGFALNLANQGSVDATGLMVRIALNQGSAMTEPVLARFFDGAGGSVLRDDMELKVGAGEALTTEVMLPRQIVEPLMIGGKPMLVPVIAFDVTYHWEGDDPDAFGQVAGSFVLGRESGASESDKLAPLPLDRASYAVDRPGARPTAVRRSQ